MRVEQPHARPPLGGDELLDVVVLAHHPAPAFLAGKAVVKALVRIVLIRVYLRPAGKAPVLRLVGKQRMHAVREPNRLPVQAHALGLGRPVGRLFRHRVQIEVPVIRGVDIEPLVVPHLLHARFVDFIEQPIHRDRRIVRPRHRHDQAPGDRHDTRLGFSPNRKRRRLVVSDDMEFAGSEVTRVLIPRHDLQRGLSYNPAQVIWIAAKNSQRPQFLAP